MVHKIIIFNHTSSFKLNIRIGVLGFWGSGTSYGMRPNTVGHSIFILFTRVMNLLRVYLNLEMRLKEFIYKLKQTKQCF